LGIDSEASVNPLWSSNLCSVASSAAAIEKVSHTPSQRGLSFPNQNPQKAVKGPGTIWQRLESGELWASVRALGRRLAYSTRNRRAGIRIPRRAGISAVPPSRKNHDSLRLPSPSDSPSAPPRQYGTQGCEAPVSAPCTPPRSPQRVKQPPSNGGFGLCR